MTRKDGAERAMQWLEGCGEECEMGTAEEKRWLAGLYRHQDLYGNAIAPEVDILRAVRNCVFCKSDLQVATPLYEGFPDPDCTGTCDRGHMVLRESYWKQLLPGKNAISPNTKYTIAFVIHSVDR